LFTLTTIPLSYELPKSKRLFIAFTPLSLVSSSLVNILASINVPNPTTPNFTFASQLHITAMLHCEPTIQGKLCGRPPYPFLSILFQAVVNVQHQQLS
jgi:hypothetical protein